jgi:hypothetical protein
MEERDYEIKKKWDFIMKDPILSISSIKKKAFDGLLAEKGLRSLCWKIYLDYIPNLETSSWKIEIDKERQHYEDLKNKFIFDPNKANKEGENWNINNPLSLEEESPWKQYFENTELQKTIKQDVERTFPDIEFFRNDNVQNILCNILFIYCKLNQDISYRQGMHEILAPILMVVDNDKIDSSNTVIQDDLIKNILDSKYVEHDSFFLFCQVMKGAKSWYEFNETISTAVDSTKEKFIVPIVAKCQRIQNEMLKVIDDDLFTALKRHEIEPQLYGLRWLRLLFSREFPMDDVLILWDGIFAEGNNLELVDWIALVMLIHIRDKIIGQEYSVCLTTLMKYPKLDDKKIVQFVENARRLKTNWVELISKNNEQKENQRNQSHQLRKNKLQSMIKSADKRLSWSGYDPLKFGKGSNKPNISPGMNNINEESNDNFSHKSSLHEKQLEEENHQLRSKVEDLKLIIKNANNQMNKCMKLINEINNNYLNDEKQTNADHLQKDFKLLLSDMNILERILGNKNHSNSLQKASPSSSNKNHSPIKEKHNVMEDSKIVHKNDILSSPKSQLSIPTINSPESNGDKMENENITNDISSDIEQNKESQISKENETDDKNKNNSILSQSPKISKSEVETINSQDQKVDDKVDNRDTLNPSSSTSLSNPSLSPVTASVVTATAITTISPPKKDLFGNKSNEFSMDTYKDNNIWGDNSKTQDYDTFEIKLDQNHQFDDIRLQDSSFGFNAFNPDNTLSNTSNNDFNTISLGNPWEDPWNKSNTTKPPPKIPSFSIKTENSNQLLNANNQLNNNVISPSSVHFNPFESPTTITTNNHTFDNSNSINSTTSPTISNNNNIKTEENKGNNLNNDRKDPLDLYVQSPLSSPQLKTDKPKIKTAIENPTSPSLSNNRRGSNPKRPSYSASYNSSNSLFSALSPSSKNKDLDKRIQENKKILFSHDDKDKSEEKYGENRRSSFYNHSNTSQHRLNNNNGSHGLFSDNEDSEDIFEFIKQSKSRNASQRVNSMISSGYSSYSKNSSSNTTTPLSPKFQSPKPQYSNVKNILNSPTFSVSKPSTSNTPRRKSSSSSAHSPLDYKAKESSHMEYVEYDPLLSPNLKSKKPFSSVNRNSFGSLPISTSNSEENFRNPIAPSITPTLGPSTTTTITNVSANNTPKMRASTSAFYRIADKETETKKNDPGVPIVIEHIQSTTVDSLDTNKNAKPVLLDPLGAGVVHSLEF